MEKSFDGHKTDKTVPPEVERKWAALVFKIYEHMIHASKVSFFVSTPQLVSNLGFLLGACELSDTHGLLDGYDDGDESTEGPEIDKLIDWTLKFVHTWSSDLHNLLGPGHYYRSRRVYSHPEYAKAHEKNTFDFLRLFRVEEKVYEGFGEVRDWASRTIKIEIVRGHKIFNMWCNENQTPFENCILLKNGKIDTLRRNQKAIPGAVGAVGKVAAKPGAPNANQPGIESIATKVRSTVVGNPMLMMNNNRNNVIRVTTNNNHQITINNPNNPNNNLNNTPNNNNMNNFKKGAGNLNFQMTPANLASIQTPQKDEKVEREKRSPILVWLNHAQIEMPGEFFDGNFIYTWQRRRYWRIHDSPIRPIQMIPGEYDFSALFVPTQNTQLTMIVFYDFKSQLCPFDKMRQFVAKHRPLVPCIVRKSGTKKALHQKRTVYMPFWKPDDFGASRIAQHFVAAIDLRSMFVKGGFGDLAVSDATPSATGDPKRVCHVQHFGLLTIRNSPRLPAPPPPPLPGIGHPPPPPPPKKGPETERAISEPNARNVEMIAHPMCIILWDSDRDLPAYMGKITGKLTEQKMEELRKEELAKKQTSKWWSW